MASRVVVALSVLAISAIANQQSSLTAEGAEQLRTQAYIRRHDVAEEVALQIGAAGQTEQVSARIAEAPGPTAAGTSDEEFDTVADIKAKQVVCKDISAMIACNDAIITLDVLGDMAACKWEVESATNNTGKCQATCAQHICQEDAPVKKAAIEAVVCGAGGCDEDQCCEATTTCAEMNTPCEGDMKNKGTEHTCRQEVQVMVGGAAAQCDTDQCCQADWTHKTFTDFIDQGLKTKDSSTEVGSTQERAQDTAVCKEVAGLTVVDRRNLDDLYDNTMVSYAKGFDAAKGKQCASQFTHHLGNFTNGRLQFCAQAVANTTICDSRFQMHKDTYTCDCLVTWAEAQCGDPDQGKWANDEPHTCIYDLNPGKLADATGELIDFGYRADAIPV